LYLVAEAAWYKAFGLSVFQMRNLSTLFGLLLLWSWFQIVHRLTGNRLVAWLCTVLLAGNYVVLGQSSFGRPEMMCAALGSAGLALYLRWRTEHPRRAILAGHTALAACAFTHPNALIWMVLWVVLAAWPGVPHHSSGRPFKMRDFALGAIPYLAGALIWGLYILQDLPAFRDQIAWNSDATNRLAYLLRPFEALRWELIRYQTAYGLGGYSQTGRAGLLIMVKGLPLAAYLISIAALLAVPRLRALPGAKILLALTAAAFLVQFSFNQKLTNYLIHVVPLYTSLLAVCLAWLWRERRQRFVAAAIAAGLVLADTAGFLYRARFNTYARSYQPAVDYLLAHASRQRPVMATSAFGFEFGFADWFVDDNSLGLYSNSKPEYFVLDEIYEVAIEGHTLHRPAVAKFVQQRIENEYRMVYNHEGVRIYAEAGVLDSRSVQQEPRNAGGGGPHLENRATLKAVRNTAETANASK
jgi:hypothetical protein